MSQMKDILIKHEARADIALQAAVNTGENLLRIFDDYVRVEIADLRQLVRLLERVRRDVKKEKGKLSNIEKKFQRTYDGLKRMHELVKQGKIHNISLPELLEPNAYGIMPDEAEEKDEVETDSFEMAILLEGFRIVGELEEIRKDIHRWAESFIGDIDDILNIIDERMDGKQP